MKTRILIVDDELSMREFLTILLEREGYSVQSAANAKDAISKIRELHFDLVISDVSMPGLSGIELLREIKSISPSTVVLMITAFSAAEQAVDAMKLGAYDYIPKPFKIDEVKLLIKKALDQQELKVENRILKQQIENHGTFCGLIGQSSIMKELFSLLEKVAGSNSTVLIQGESGTGKELAARAIHQKSGRKNKPFVAVNCGAIPETLIESELFGHKKGSFTGAVSDRSGLFEQAEGGTLLLDEIGELPLAMQTKLLRVLQEREFRRVGDSVTRKADIRLITATNRDLEEQVKNGSFREDLYYRINVFQITMPPLRERVEDIPPLVEHFFKALGGDSKSSRIITPAALKILMGYHFPGNIRELVNIIERSLIINPTTITEQSLPKQISNARTCCLNNNIEIPEKGLLLEPLLEDLEKKYLLKALERTGGGKKKAATLLGMTFRSFRYRLAKFGLDSDGE